MTRPTSPVERHLQHMGIAPRRPSDGLHNLCPRCLKASGLHLPKAYADLGGLGRCSLCGEVADCRDHELLHRFATAKIDPHTVYLRYPRLRRPLNGPNITIAVIDAMIQAHWERGR